MSGDCQLESQGSTLRSNDPLGSSGHRLRPLHIDPAHQRAGLLSIICHRDSQRAGRVLDEVVLELHAVVVHQCDEPRLLVIVHLVGDDACDDDASLVGRRADRDVVVKDLGRRARPLPHFDVVNERVRHLDLQQVEAARIRVLGKPVRDQVDIFAVGIAIPLQFLDVGRLVVAEFLEVVAGEDGMAVVVPHHLEVLRGRGTRIDEVGPVDVFAQGCRAVAGSLSAPTRCCARTRGQNDPSWRFH